MSQAKSVSRKQPQRRFEKLEERNLLAAHFVDFDVLEPSDYTHTEVLVRFNDDVKVDALKKWTGTDLPSERIAVLNAPLGEGFRADSQLWEIPVLPGQSVEDLIRHYNSLDIVDFAEPNYRMQAAAAPNDNLYGDLWGMRDIGAESAWDTRTDSSPIIVGVIDSGVDYTHPDLVDNMWTNPGEIAGNGLDDDGNGYIDDVVGYDFEFDDSDPMDVNSHGTHVAGTIGARGNNNIGVAGVGWNASLMALKVIGQGSNAAVARSIDYATDNGAKITNNSYGFAGTGVRGSQAISNAVSRAKNAGVLYVVAAGNSRAGIPASDMDGNFNSWPAELSKVHDNVITVSATAPNGSFAGFSHWGVESVQIAAPGSAIRSTIPGGGYGNKSGTSMASPIVAGAAALLWAERPQLSYLEIKDAILNTTRPEHLDRVGRGVLDLGAAMELITGGGNQNQAPVAVDDIASVAQDSSVLIPVLSNDSDPDGDPITIESFTQGSHGTVALSGTDLLYTPNADYNGVDSFTYTINDGNGGSDSAFVTIQVNGRPDAVDDIATVAEDSSVLISVLNNDSDPDGDSITIESFTQGTHGTVALSGTDLLYTPNADYNGVDSFTYTINDGNGLTDDATVNMNITPVNDAPIANDDSDSTLADMQVRTNLVANDTDKDSSIDGETVSVIDQPSNGFIINHLDGTVTYNPFQGFTGSDSYSYTVRDNEGAVSNIALVTIDVQAATSEQVLFEDSFENLGENWIQDDQGDWFLSRQRATDGIYSLEVDGRANDATVEFANGVNITGFSGVILSFDWLIERGFDQGEYVSLDISGDGGMSWTTDVLQLRGNEDRENFWNPGYPAGQSTRINLADWLFSTDLKVRFRSYVSAAREDANIDNVRIVGKTAGEINNAPIAVDDDGDGFTTTEDDAFLLPNLLANDSDPDVGDEIYVQGIDTTDTVGSVSLIGNGEYQYDPSGAYDYLAVGESATDSFEYTVTDGRGGNDTAAVTILINGVNDTPVANDDSGDGYLTEFETPLTTPNILSNDFDPDISDVLMIDDIDASSILGSVTDNQDGTLLYTPAFGFSGSETFTYTISDGNGGSDTASITVVVKDPNENPVAVDDNDATLRDVERTTPVIANDTDSDGTIDPTSVAIVSQPTNGSVTNNFNGTVTYTPNSGFVGTDSYTYTVRDDDGAVSNTATVEILVTAPSSGEILFEDSFEGLGDQWIQDGQRDWFLSRQRATDGNYSLEVDGRANDATVEFATGVDISGYSQVILSFDWLIERGFDRGEYLALDISGDGGLSWTTNVLQLRGNESLENVWNPGYLPGQSTQVDLSDWLGSRDLKVRFRALVSGSREDANVDNVLIVGFNNGLPGGGGGGGGQDFAMDGTGSSFSFMMNGSSNQGASNTPFGSSSSGQNASNSDQFFGAFGNPSNNGSFDDWLNDDEFDGLINGMLSNGNLF